MTILTTDLIGQTPDELARIWDTQHISKIAPSDVRHSDLKNYLEQLKKIGLKVDEVGRSGGGREIYQIEFGHGPLKVFMWSQMHGDEPTATSALLDMRSEPMAMIRSTSFRFTFVSPSFPSA